MYAQFNEYWKGKVRSSARMSLPFILFSSGRDRLFKKIFNQKFISHIVCHNPQFLESIIWWHEQVDKHFTFLHIYQIMELRYAHCSWAFAIKLEALYPKEKLHLVDLICYQAVKFPGRFSNHGNQAQLCNLELLGIKP